MKFAFRSGQRVSVTDTKSPHHGTCGTVRRDERGGFNVRLDNGRTLTFSSDALALATEDDRDADPTTHVRIAALATVERDAVKMLTPEERKAALLLAARAKAATMFPPEDATGDGA